MRCDAVQQQLLGGYLDDELETGLRKGVDQHLAGCHACREFLSVARELDVAVASESSRQEPSAHVWNAIRARIEERQVTLGERIVTWWEDVLWGFRPTFVYGSLASALLVFVVVAAPMISFRQQAGIIVDKEEITKLVYFDEYNAPALGIEEGGKGAAVENLL